MTGPRGNLLWITYDGSTRQRPRELRSALKQHVMLNFIDKKAHEDGGRVEARRRSPSHVDAISVRRKSLEPLTCPQPTIALVCHEDQLVYRAAWWHCYVHPDFLTVQADVPRWRLDNKQMLNAGFWEVARQDQTLLEVFMSFAAAKEAAVKCLPDAPACYRHRGKALMLLADDVNDEGPALRVEAIVAIALLCFNYFVERDYDSAEYHCQALAKLIPGRMSSFSNIVWQIIISGDMYLSAVRVRGPSLPYHLHQEFRSLYFYNPNTNIVNATLNNLAKFPPGLVFSEDQVQRTKRLMVGLHSFARAQTRFDIDWTVAWAHIYDVSYLIAQLQIVVERHGCLEELIILVGCQMQFWGNMTIFVNLPDIQSHQLHRLEQAMTSIDPESLCDRWLESTGSLDLLLWTLCNAGVSVLHLKTNRGILTESLPPWLQPAVTHIFAQLGIKQPEDLKARLQQMPFTDVWNGRACQAMLSWVDNRATTPPPTPPSESRAFSRLAMSSFERLRWAFDYWLEAFPRQDERR